MDNGKLELGPHLGMGLPPGGYERRTARRPRRCHRRAADGPENQHLPAQRPQLSGQAAALLPARQRRTAYRHSHDVCRMGRLHNGEPRLSEGRKLASSVGGTGTITIRPPSPYFFPFLFGGKKNNS